MRSKICEAINTNLNGGRDCPLSDRRNTNVGCWRIILAGHSMGGGIVQAYAASDEPQLADAYLLFAPLMGRGLPGAFVPNFIRLHMPRIIGISLLNRIGFRKLNRMPVMRFGLGNFDGHIDHYTYNAAVSMNPNDYVEGLTALKKPLLVVIGKRDTQFGTVPEKIVEAVKRHSRGEIVVIDIQAHHVQNASATIDVTSSWMERILDRSNAAE